MNVPMTTDKRMVNLKPIRRKVLKSERTGGRVPGLLLDLQCGHFVEVVGWGNGSGIATPKTTICDYCSGRKAMEIRELK